MAAARSPIAGPSFLRRRYREGSRRRAERVLIALVGALLLYALILGDNGLVRLMQERRQVENLREDLRWLQIHSEDLGERIDDLDRPASFTLEQVARERYGLTASGERVIHVLEPGQTTDTPPMPLEPGGEDSDD
jgi:cell division protein FtsB